MLDEKFRLQQESKALAQHLNAVLNDKFGQQDHKGFDSDTPIDKALAFLQFIIAVCSFPLHCCGFLIFAEVLGGHIWAHSPLCLPVAKRGWREH